MNFFFQAEDGIRDTSVTGVQTCALPIYLRLAYIGTHNYDIGVGLAKLVMGVKPKGGKICLQSGGAAAANHNERLQGIRDRSEERRVGKECARRSSLQGSKDISNAIRPRT